ncbi:Cytochrome P450 [Amanita muscaria]
MDNTTTLNAVLAVAVATLLYVPFALKALVNNYKLRSIPTVGSSGFWTSYLGALRFFCHAHSMMQEGYDKVRMLVKLLHSGELRDMTKYRDSIFKLPMFSKWMIMVSGPQMINEIRSASDDYLSGVEAFRENQFHIEVVKLPLTRNIGPRLADIQDEIVTAFNDNIRLQGNEWTTVIAYSTIIDIVCRTSNRMFVGLPLCRNPDYLQLNKQLTIDVIKAAHILKFFPSFLRPTVARLLPHVNRDVQLGYKHLEPLFNDRLKQDACLGKDWPERPLDNRIPNPEQSNAQRIRTMVLSMLLINFTAIHTTTMALTHVLYDLATRPEYVQPMRDEVEVMIQEEGWSKSAIGKMRKLDSFIKESLRLSNFFFTMQRKVMKDFTFSNGVTTPAGNTIAAPIITHVDPEYYADANTFDGFRFERMRNGEGMGNKHQVISLDLNYILFGHGRHACPGRFFAATELKVMLAHILLNYDVQMANGGGRPANRVFGQDSMPDPTAQVMFRKRVQSEGCKE